MRAKATWRLCSGALHYFSTLVESSELQSEAAAAAVMSAAILCCPACCCSAMFPPSRSATHFQRKAAPLQRHSSHLCNPRSLTAPSLLPHRLLARPPADLGAAASRDWSGLVQTGPSLVASGVSQRWRWKNPGPVETSGDQWRPVVCWRCLQWKRISSQQQEAGRPFSVFGC